MTVALRDIRQGNSSSCGLAAVRTVLRFWGLANGRPRIVVDLRDGSHPASIVAALRAADLRTIAGEFLPDDLRDFCRTGRPVIALIQRHGSGHYVIVSRATAGRVWFQDPATGPSVMGLREWLDCWQDVDVFGTHYRRFGIVAYP